MVGLAKARPNKYDIQPMISGLLISDVLTKASSLATPRLVHHVLCGDFRRLHALITEGLL